MAYHKITEKDLAGFTAGKNFAFTTRDGGKRLDLFFTVDNNLKINSCYRVFDGDRIVYFGNSGRKAVRIYNAIPK